MAKHEKTKEPGIYRRGLGQYEVKIRRKGVSASRTFDSFAEAVQFKTETVSKIDGNTYVDQTRERETSLSDVIDLYLKQVTLTKRGAVQEANRLQAWKKEVT